MYPSAQLTLKSSLVEFLETDLTSLNSHITSQGRSKSSLYRHGRQGRVDLGRLSQFPKVTGWDLKTDLMTLQPWLGLQPRPVTGPTAYHPHLPAKHGCEAQKWGHPCESVLRCPTHQRCHRGGEGKGLENFEATRHTCILAQSLLHS